MSDEEVARNIRYLFLAFSDHKFPKHRDKFSIFLKNNMCSGISDKEFVRLERIIKENKFVTFHKDGTVKVNLACTPEEYNKDIPFAPKT
jgi:hypothetical protein